MKRFLFFLILLIGFDRPALASFEYYRPLTILHTKLPTDDQTDFIMLARTLTGTVNTSGTSVSWVSGDKFRAAWVGNPILINGTAYTVSTYTNDTTITLTATAGTQTGVTYYDTPWARTAANGGRVRNSNGYDLRPYTDSTCTTAIAAYEFEASSYGATTGYFSMWVKVASVSHTSDTTIYLCLGNTALTTDGSSTTTWSDYSAVWHFGDGSTLSLTDSSGNGNTLTNVSATGNLAIQQIPKTITVGSSVGSGAVAYPHAVVNGNLLVVSSGWYQGCSGPTISDTLSTSFTKVQKDFFDSTHLAVWYGFASSGGANTVTVTCSSSTFWILSVAEYANINAFDTSVTASFDSSSSPQNSGNITTAANNEILIGAIAGYRNAGTFDVSDSGAVRVTFQNGSDCLGVLEHIKGTAGTYSMNFAQGGGNDHGGIVVLAFSTTSTTAVAATATAGAFGAALSNGAVFLNGTNNELTESGFAGYTTSGQVTFFVKMHTDNATGAHILITGASTSDEQFIAERGTTGRTFYGRRWPDCGDQDVVNYTQDGWMYVEVMWYPTGNLSGSNTAGNGGDTGPCSSTGFTNGSGYTTRIGTRPYYDNVYSNFDLDELRVRTTTPTTFSAVGNRHTAEYNSYTDPSTFFSFGDEVAFPSNAIPLVFVAEKSQ